ncbi:MAG: molecular chaperone HtpG, partial [Clostridia bacterium]|nr:molecular chaperone HtpG [Clostridia bacterium]
MDDAMKKGGISVDTEHIFPIIKKWLYSEKDIFLRELVSNAADAVTKLKRLEALGQVSDIGDDFRITVTLDKNARTLSIADNGIGMTEDEVLRYICQIALSGALDFIQKYEGEGDAAGSGIIGHFGLGFYSAFMVSDTVEIKTCSYLGEPAVHWTCTEAGEYSMNSADTTERGTVVTLHIAEGEEEYLVPGKIREMLDKYCAFMPVDIYFVDVDAEPEKASVHEEGCDCEECSHETKPAPVNDTHPLWQKAPSACTPEEYNTFYHKLFGDFRDPLFYIHINADYPLNFKGILYFPRLNHEYESLEGQIKLFYNQVFVADNIKEVIPEYMLMFKGVLDCPELPLNVSRSYLQSNSYVAKVSAHIVKKVADKLNALCNTDRETYEK